LSGDGNAGNVGESTKTIMIEEVLGDTERIVLRVWGSKNDSEKKESSNDRKRSEIAGSGTKPIAKSFRSRNGVRKELKGGGDDLDDDHKIAFEETHEKFG